MNDQLQQSFNAVLNKYGKDYKAKGVLANCPLTRKIMKKVAKLNEINE
jgi:hypothetical protein